MAFTGELEKLPLADVFQSCHQNSMTGALAIRDKRGERLVSWEKGYVTGCAGLEGEGNETLAAEMVRRRVVDQDTLGRPSRFFKRKGSLKRSLKRRNVLNSGEFDQFARSVVLERIYECFLLETGTFEFLEKYDKSRFDDDEESAGVKINPAEILMEAMRRVDEWSRIKRSIPSFREVYVAARTPNDDDEPLDREILVMTASGTLSLEDVLGQSPAARFKTCEAILSLVEAGAVRVATVPEYLELGQKAEEGGDFDAAASFYGRGLSYERGNAGLNDRRIAVLEKLDRKQEAADERKRYAGILLEKGDRSAAAEQFEHAAELVPSDPLPLERLLDLRVQDKTYEQAKETGDKLVKLYLKLGLADLAKKVFPRLLLLKPKDPWLRRRMAETHAELRENGTAAGIYKELAQELLKEEQQAPALDLLRKAIKLQPDDKKTQELVKDLETGEHKAKQRRRRVFTVAMVALAGVLAALAWCSYEAYAIVHLRRMTEENLVLDHGCEGLLNTINGLQLKGADGDPIYRGTYAAEWSRQLAKKFARSYLREALFSGQTFVLADPPETTLKYTEVEAELRLNLQGVVLNPESGQPEKAELSLAELLDRAEEYLEDNQRDGAAKKVDEIMRRVTQARLVMSKSDMATRGTNDFRRYYSDLQALLPRVYLALGLTKLQVPEARGVLEEYTLSLEQKDGAAKNGAEK